MLSLKVLRDVDRIVVIAPHARVQYPRAEQSHDSLDAVVQRVSYLPSLFAPGRRALSPCYRLKQRNGIWYITRNKCQC